MGFIETIHITGIGLILLVFRWLLGFYLQTVPVAIICTYPFKGHFRFNDYTFYLIIAFTIFFESIVWLLAVSWEFFLNGGTASDYLETSDLFFIGSLVLLLIIFVLCVKAKTSYKLFVFIPGMSYGFSLEITNRTINNFFPHYTDLISLYSWPDLIHYALLNLILFIPILRLMKVIRGSFSANLNIKIWRILTVMLFGILSILMIFYEIPYAINIDPLDTLYIFINALFLFIFVIYYWIFSVIREERIMVRNEEKWRFLAESYKLEEKNLEEIRKVKHELRHHLSAIQLYLNKSDYNGAKNYLDKLSILEDELSVQGSKKLNKKNNSLRLKNIL